MSNEEKASDDRGAAGEIISWKARDCGRVTVEALRDALDGEGFDPALVQESSPKSALKRALRQLGKDKVIREVGCDDADRARFQLTGTVKLGDGSNEELIYSKEAIFALDLNTGGITADTAGQPLKEIAAWYSDALKERTRADIKRVLQRLFDEQASIFCINPENGGSYFVPEEHRLFLDRIDRMLRSLGGKLARFPVIDGTSEGTESIADAMEHWFDELFKDLNQTVETWDESTNTGSFRTQAERYKAASFKLECAAAYLGDRAGTLQAQLEASKQAMAAKILGTDSVAAAKYKAAAVTDQNGDPVKLDSAAINEVVMTSGGRVNTDGNPPVSILQTENGCVVSGGGEDVHIGGREECVAVFIERVKKAERQAAKAAKEAKAGDGSTEGVEAEDGEGAAEAEDDGKMAAVGS